MTGKTEFEKYLDAFKAAASSPMAATSNFEVMLDRADRVYERAASKQTKAEDGGDQTQCDAH